MTTTPGTLTLDEFLALPEEKPALEYADGEVTQKVSPQGQHAILQAAWIRHVNQFAEPIKLALALPELRGTFGGAARVPDVAVYLWQRIPRLATGLVANRFTEPPDVAIEIVSPGQSVTSLIRRCRWFVDQGVRIALLVDPEDFSVLAFRPGDRMVALHDADRIDLDEVLPGFELTAAELFSALRLD